MELLGCRVDFYLNCQALFQNCCPILCPYQQHTRFLFLHNSDNICYCLSFLIATPPGVKWCCGFALWFPNDCHAEHLFIGFFTIHRPSLVKCLFKYFVLPPSPVLLFLLSRREDSIYILGTSHLPDMYFADIFSQSAACLHFRVMFFEVQRFSILKRSALSTFKVILYFWYHI